MLRTHVQYSETHMFYLFFDSPEMYFAMCSVIHTCAKVGNVDHLYVETINFKLLEEDLKHRMWHCRILQSMLWFLKEFKILFIRILRSRRDGIAINTKMMAGATVQMVSIICPSRMNRLVCLFWIILIIV